MHKRVIFLVIGIVSCFDINSQGLFSWARGFGSTGRDLGYSVAVDGLGNVYSTGTFSGTADFDPGPGTYTLATKGDYDVFISKLDMSGNFVWAKQIGGITDDWGQSIAMDPLGNVCLTGFFGGVVDFNPGPAVNNYTAIARDVFVCKLDPSGAFVWAKQFKGTTYDFDWAYSLAVDQLGNVYTTGYFSKTVDFDPGPGTYTLAASGVTDIFVSKLDGNGIFVWAKSFPGNNLEESHSIAVDKSGNVYTTGYFGGTADFDPGVGSFPLSSNGNYDVFLSKLDASGNFSWAKQFGNSNFDSGYSVAVDSSGNVYMTGVYEGTVDFDPGVGVCNFTTNIGDRDIFITKFDTYGAFIWAKQIGEYGFEVAFGITVDDRKNVYTTGQYGLTDFDPGVSTYSLAAVANEQVFVSVLDSTGAFVWAKGMGGERGYGIALDASRNVYVTGEFKNSPDFDPGTGVYNLTSAGDGDAFVVKLDNAAIGVKESSKDFNKVKTFPNPNSGSFVVQIDNIINNGELVLYDSFGRKVFVQHITQGANAIKINNLSSGLYNYVLLQDKQKVRDGKIVIE